MEMDRDSAFAGRLEVVDTGRRRRWSVAEKVRIVEESYRGHLQVSRTARRYGISKTLLFRWRRAYREGSLGGGSASFVPAVVVPDGAAQPSGETAGRSGRMEIVALGGRRVIVDADVDAAALAQVIEVLEG